MKNKPAIVSVHDVMPETLALVSDLLSGVLRKINKSNILLLVVPGLNWQPNQIQQLKQWQAQGYEIAGHGWVHQAHRVGTLYHRLHSILISRQAAEHLSHSQAQRLLLLKRNYAWFIDHGFTEPALYVPPAWALGRLSQSKLKQQPYQFFELTSGLYDVKAKRLHRLPLVGFEADTPLRAWLLTIWNRMNCLLASKKRPLRISIHPYDMQYLIADQLMVILDQTVSVHWRHCLRKNNAASLPRKVEEDYVNPLKGASDKSS